MTPDFSPAMLKLFLRARATHAHHMKPAKCGVQATAKREKARLRKLAHITASEMEFAWMGRLNTARARAALWAVIGHFPGDHGLTLTDDGGQSSVLTASTPSGLPPDGAPNGRRTALAASAKGRTSPDRKSGGAP